MNPVKFREPTEKEYKKNGYEEEHATYEEYVEAQRAYFDERLGKAQTVYLSYLDRFTRVNAGDREAVAVIRNEMREDEGFWSASSMIAEMVEGEMSWIPSVFRSEAKRASRSAGELFERLRAEKLAARAAEREELQHMPTFGMF